MPPLFQFLTVLAFKIFSSEEVDVAIIEVGMGGLNDSTNVIKDPVVCGISPLGMDHIETLGDTLGLIASHKAGIFKPQVPAFTVPQLSEAMEVLEERANGLMAPLEVAKPLDCKKLNGIKLSLSGDHQFTNAGLAVSLCKCWLQRTGNWGKQFQQVSLEEEILPEAFLRGLSTARLSGRAQIVHDSSLDMSGVNISSSGDLIFYLDGAHSPESMEACARWYSTAVKENNNNSSFSPSCSKFLTMEGVWGNGRANHENNESNKIFKQILLFNCMDVRDPQILLPTLVNTCASSGTYFSKAIFVPSISKYSKVTSASSAVPLDNPPKDLTWQFNLQRVWEKIIHGKDVSNKSLHMKIPESFPSRKFIHEDVSRCNPTDGHFACSVVVSSLPLTIKWLRDSVKENSSLRIQVLVTGSLHLVGDVLKLLRR
ncbi:folylpolyglutamate synthase [Olea europaea var. sylvestris]|uniref:folylpolyglutamate synthase n=1 Tax=Olea europaea var. sylvestris TaxID=158386 RepID=UPI000C1D2CAD|nr:folylpolyglutamate synthase [Olea europaea var. sylvestris]XP_022882868.1 folylpolyglutamate synthase [Olea europaea var. sylvestris]XP_022882869.1 folylpolyglutamate synthase [Olea europaea var. sylvestris]